MKNKIPILITTVILIAAALLAIKVFNNPERLALKRRNLYDGIMLAEDVGIAPSSTPKQQKAIRELLTAAQTSGSPAELRIVYPYYNAVFPPEIIPPTFLWNDDTTGVDTWLINIEFEDGRGSINYVTFSPPLPPPVIDERCITNNNEIPKQNHTKNWTPDTAVWEAFKSRSVNNPATVSIYGFNRLTPDRMLSKGQVRIETSEDPVGAPIFYRDVPLMPSELETRDTSGFVGRTIQPLPKKALPLITWRLRDVSRRDSRVLLKDLPTCANCHSFSRDGSTLGMDVDGPDKDKGAYAITPVSQNMRIEKKKKKKKKKKKRTSLAGTTSSKKKKRGQKTIGFLSRISPDGRHVLSTVNETVYVVNYPQYEFLQVFFPTRGILAWYSKDTDEIKPLPGADNPEYVHCDPVWSPDGNTIIFARARAKDAYTQDQVMPRYANEGTEVQIQYDLYRMPFNNGKGGKPEPIEGASMNGLSNTFPKVTPDGKYIVFVKCKNGQLMRPDSSLWIVPFEGGKARVMKCNTPMMNSWHSFSPNGRWMVFSSKARSFYTQMYLTHIDENGDSTPPVLIENATADNRAVNLPEFVNTSYDTMENIEIPAIDHIRYFLRSDELVKEGRYDEAVKMLRNAAKKENLDRKFLAMTYSNLGSIAFMTGKDPDTAIKYLNTSLGYDPEFAQSHFLMGMINEMLGKNRAAISSHEKALRYDPANIWPMNRLARCYLLSDDPQIRDTKKALEYAENACAMSAFKEPALLEILGGAYSELGRMDDAVRTAEKARAIAGKAGRDENIERIEREISLYKEGKPISELEMKVP